MFKDNKFSGELAEDIMETLKLYAICALQHTLGNAQKEDFFVHILDGLARKFCFENSSENRNHSEIVRVMVQEYVSDASHLQVKGMLKTLRLRTFMNDQNISDVSDGFTRIVTHINELVPRCPPNFRSNAHKIGFLRKAMKQFQEWSRVTIENIMSQKYTLNDFLTALHESIQNLRQMNLLTNSDCGTME